MPITVYHILLYKGQNIVVETQSLADGKTGELERNQSSSTNCTNTEFIILDHWLV